MGYNVGEIYQSNSDFLKADDIGANFWTVVIRSVDMKNFDDGSRKLFIMFDELDKGLVLNKTNADMIGDLYGKDTDGWIGQQIMLFTAPVDYQGKKVQAIRVRAPAPVQHPGRQQFNSPLTSPQRPLNHGQSYAQASGGSGAYDGPNAPPPASADDYGAMR